MKVLLGVEHTVFKIDGVLDEYKQLMDFIQLNFSTKFIKDNILFIPLSTADNHKRKFLMKWLYSYYKKDAINFKEELKFELIKRMDKPIHIHFLPKENQAITLSLTFYDNASCQLISDTKSDKCNLYLLQYFSGHIRLKSLNFNLYEITAQTKKHKSRLEEFVKMDNLDGLNIRFQYNKKAFELFLNIEDEKEENSEVDRAFMLLKVNKNDSLSKIKKSYKKLAKAYHPDLSKLDDAESTKKFQIISDAFTLIKQYKLAA